MATESDTLKSVQKDVKTLLHELDELKKILAVKNAQDDTFRDLIIEYLVNKKDIKIGDIATITKTPRVKKNEVTTIIVDTYHKDMYNVIKPSVDTVFIKTFTKININNIVDKLNENSANNVRNCFIWCYSRINEIRIEVLTNNKEIEVYVKELYNNKEELIKHNKTLNDLLKYEGSEVFKKYKDEQYFKNYCSNLKTKYKKTIE
jgi:hypothetical protein